MAEAIETDHAQARTAKRKLTANPKFWAMNVPERKHPSQSATVKTKNTQRIAELSFSGSTKSVGDSRGDSKEHPWARPVIKRRSDQGCRNHGAKAGIKHCRA